MEGGEQGDVYAQNLLSPHGPGVKEVEASCLRPLQKISHRQALR